MRAGVEAVYVPYVHERPIYVQRLNQMVYIKSRDVPTADGRLETHVWVIELYHTERMGQTFKSWNSSDLLNFRSFSSQFSSEKSGLLSWDYRRKITFIS